MRPYQYVPGVPSAGHIANGSWHPSGVGGCVKCDTRTRTERIEAALPTTPPVRYADTQPETYGEYPEGPRP